MGWGGRSRDGLTHQPGWLGVELALSVQPLPFRPGDLDDHAPVLLARTALTLTPCPAPVSLDQARGVILATLVR